MPELSKAELDRCLKEAIGIAKLAGLFMLDCMERNKELTAESKSTPVDMVTEYDKKVEDMILTRLAKEFPDFDMLGEESAYANGPPKLTNKPTWIVDPIDGTLSFMHKSFDCCTSIGLAVNKKAVLGVVYSPGLNELYTGVKGQGSFCNGVPLQVSPQTSLKNSLVSTHFPSFTRSPAFVDSLFNVWKELMKVPTQGCRAYGSAAIDMCSVAKGRLDAYFEVGICAWDVCAGAIIIEEAGGLVLDITGGEFDLENRRLLCTSSPELAKEILTIVKKLDLSTAKL
ncbi:Inositol monophosphatase 3 [Diplonema papillatum]|nr:Inositol monophosphatase 3 [Diplonema papillatum]